MTPLQDIDPELDARLERWADVARRGRAGLAELERVLASHAARRGHRCDPRVRLAVASLVRSAPAAAAWLARDLGWSERHLRRRFGDALGLGPGRLRRIARFARTWRRVAAAPPAQGWAALAVDAGYSDQAHLIRDFRALAGDSPARLFGEQWYRTTAIEAPPGPMLGSFNPAAAASR